MMMTATLAYTDSVGLLLVLNLVFAGIALLVGFVAGAWFSTKRHPPDDAATGGQEPEEDIDQLLTRERMELATDRLRDLATNMATDVGEHSARVGEITNDLKLLDTSDVKATGAGLVNALTQIVAANETLQARLAKAEEQIASQAQEIHHHETEARTDALTGLANRRAFDDELRRRQAEAQRKGTPLSLMLLDIDYFKAFNDTHGHQAGDEVLRAVSQGLAAACREMDLPCRYGGEEFAIVMPATTVAEGKVAAERIRKAVEAVEVQFDGKQLHVTGSVGLAQLRPAEEITHLLRRADDALYQSKDAGRNCGHWHDGQRCQPVVGRVGRLVRRTGQSGGAGTKSPLQLLNELPNRTKFADDLRRRIAESNRTEQPLAVMVAELAGYEALKEEQGPDVCCGLLDAVATGLAGALREMDLLARLAENRFGALLPGSDEQNALVVARRTAEAVQETPLSVDDVELIPKFQVGIAEFSPGDTVETMVGRAEEALALGLVTKGMSTTPVPG